MYTFSMSVGLDITTKGIYVAVLSQRGIQYTLNALDFVPLEKKAELTEQLINIKKRIKLGRYPFFFRLAQQNINIDQDHIVVKRFAIPDLNELAPDQAYMQIGEKLSDNLGMPSSKLFYDFLPIQKLSNTVEVYVCRKSVIENILNSLEVSGFRLSSMEPQLQTLLRLYHRVANRLPEQNALILSFTDHEIQLCLTSASNEFIFRKLPFPAMYDELPQSERFQALISLLTDTIQRQFQLFSGSTWPSKIKECHVFGCTNQSELAELLTQQFGWEVKLLDPFIDVQKPITLLQSIEKPFEYWSTAIGLALRGKNHA